MGYSYHAMQGVKDNGRHWKQTISGLPTILRILEDAVEAYDVDTIDENLRNIHKLFYAALKDKDLSSSELEDLEWFEFESCLYEADNDELDEWQHEFNYRLNTLYDACDYYRIWVRPDSHV